MTEQELAQIEARNAPDGGPFVWAPTADVYRLLVEVRMLRGMLRNAFNEGAEFGDCEGLVSSSPTNMAEGWNASAVRLAAGLPEVEVPEREKRPSLFDRMRDFDAGYSAHTVTFPLPPKEGA